MIKKAITFKKMMQMLYYTGKNGRSCIKHTDTVNSEL